MAGKLVTPTKTKYEQYRAAREFMDQVYADTVASEGRFRIGPSSKGGVYVESKPLQTGEKGSAINGITRDEAAWLCGVLIDLYGLTPLEIGVPQWWE